MAPIRPADRLTLVTGDRQLSSWSLRPWLLLRHLGLPFDEIRLRLDTPGFAATIADYSPTRRVPVLLDGDLTVWDSLAICEYASELAGAAGWPADPAARAHARSISAEMHSGFAALRSQWPMQAASTLRVDLDADGRADVARIDASWQECLAKRPPDGPWLFGHYSIADAMYAPVVLRFVTYGAAVSAAATAYVATAMQDRWLKEWLSDARAEVAPSTAAPAGGMTQ